MTYRRWLDEAGVSAVTGWRWARRGWIKTTNIAGRLYVTREEIDSFKRKAASGDFAKRATGAAAIGASRGGGQN